MDVSGQIKSICPPEVLVSALHDAPTLSRLLPGDFTLEAVGDGRYAFSITKSIGPIKLTLPGEMTLTSGLGHDLTLSARAAHLIGGRVDLDLTLTFDQHGGLTRLAYAGTVEATGLAGRVLREHQVRVNSALRAGMIRLKDHAEWQARTGNQPDLSAGSRASSD